jgi:hypothetical protein
MPIESEVYVQYVRQGETESKVKECLGLSRNLRKKCIACESKWVCTSCNRMKPADAFENNLRQICKECKSEAPSLKTCRGCNTEKPHADFLDPKHSVFCAICQGKRRPACANCGAVAKSVVSDAQKVNGIWYMIYLN